MKKLNRKLLPAFAMLLLSAVLMSTASFAWFSANGQVKAEGMVVSANAPAALWISTSANSSFSTSIKLEGVGQALMPATVDVVGVGAESGQNNTGVWQFHTLSDKGYDAVNNAGTLAGELLDSSTSGKYGTAVKAPTADDTDFGEYVLKQEFYLRLEGRNDGTTAEAKAINAAVTLSGEATDLIYKSLRVAIVSDGANVITATGATALSAGGYQVFAFEGAFTDGKTTGAKVTAQCTDNILTLAAQETVKVVVYVWFEGNDEDCKNTNSNFINEYGITIDFTASAHAHTYNAESKCTICGAACAHATYGDDNKCTACGADKPVAG